MAKLTETERQRLAALLAEAKSRGLESKLRDLKVQESKGKRSFFTDDSGYFVRRDGRHYIPTDTQKKFLQSNARFVLARGSRGSGKSALGAQKALKKLSEGKSGTIANPKFEDLKKSTWVEFREWLPWDNVIPRHKYMGDIGWSPHQPFQIAFNNGAIAYLQGFNSPDTARGANVNWLWYDEAGSDEDGMAWKIAIAAVRVGKDPQAWITTTPKGKLHWIYDFFIKRELPEKLVEMIEKIGDGRPIIEEFFLSIDDNMGNLDPGIVTALMTAYVEGSYLYKQEVKGEFVIEGGSRGSSNWFDYHMLDNPAEVVKKRIRYWDFAATEKQLTGKKKNDPDETCSTLLSWDGDIKFIIEHQHSGHWEWADIKDEVVKMARIDGPYVTIWVEQEGGSGGKNQVAAIREFVNEQLGSQWKVEGHRPEGDKIQRADIWFAEASRGQFYCVKGNWNQSFFDQLDNFPEARHDDKIDSVSGARICIAPINKIWKSIEFIHL